MSNLNTAVAAVERGRENACPLRDRGEGAFSIGKKPLGPGLDGVFLLVIPQDDGMRVSVQSG